MSKRRSYEIKLLDDINEHFVANQWYSCKGRPDYDKFVAAVKVLIDCWYPLEFNSDYTRVRRLAAEWRISSFSNQKKLAHGVTIKKVEKGCMVEIQGKNGMMSVASPAYYEIFFNDKLIAIESI